MKRKILTLLVATALLVPFPVEAYTYIKWTAFGSIYQSASFSFNTEPITVNANEIRKVNYSTLPLCQSLKDINLPQVDCIKKIEATTNGKDWLLGISNSYIQVRQQVKDSPANLTVEWARTDIDNMPGEFSNGIAGSRSSLWTFPGITHKNGSEFLVSYQIATWATNNKLNYEESFTEIEVQPVVASLIGTPPTLNENLSYSATWVDGKQCFESSKVNYCLKFYPFDSTEIRFRLTINLTKASESLNSNTWMYAHSFAPYLQQMKVPGVSGSQEVVFELSPAAIQIPTIVLDSEDLVNKYIDALYPPLQTTGLSEQVKVSYEETKKHTLDLYLKGIRLNNGNYSVIDNLNSFSPRSTYLMGQQDAFMSPENTKEFIGLRVQTLPSGSVGAGELYQTLKACPSTMGVAGLISTNATAAETTPPILDKVTQTLKYRVAAPHLKENSDLNSGFYRLQLNPQVAKCIWGENLLGAKAEVSVVSDSGEAQVVTSTFIFNDDAAIFEVSGFHYSAGIINMKLVVQNDAKPTSTPVVEKVTNPPTIKPKLITITCVKGKLSKKVTAVSPKCPAGYKKK
jgi:hypothetical protein